MKNCDHELKIYSPRLFESIIYERITMDVRPQIKLQLKKNL